MAFALSSPINTALLLYTVYQVQKLLFPSNSIPPAEKTPTEFKQSYSWMPARHPPTLLFTTYTPKTLEPFSGRNDSNGRILLNIKGTVFDVSAGRSFYGPGGCRARRWFPYLFVAGY